MPGKKIVQTFFQKIPPKNNIKSSVHVPYSKIIAMTLLFFNIYINYSIPARNSFEF